MARIVGGIAASHTPTIGFAYDRNKRDDPVWAPIFENFAMELSGIEHLEGTYPFTLERSVKAYRINDYLHRMIDPSHREAFLGDPEASFDAARSRRKSAN